MSDEQRVHLGLTQELAADTVAGLRVLRGIGGEDLFLARFQAESKKVQAAAVRTAHIRALLDAMQVFLPGLFVVIVTWLGARLALQGELTVGQLVAFYGYTAFLVLPLRTVTEAAHKFTAARVAVSSGDHRDDARAHVRRGRTKRPHPPPPRTPVRSPTRRPVWSSHPDS